MAPPRVYHVLDGGEQDGGTDLLVAGIVATPPQIAQALSIAGGPKSFLRQYVKHHPEAPEQPVELVSLWFPLAVFSGSISGTPFASAGIPDKSIRQHFDDLDQPFVDVDEEIRSRGASEHEASALNIERGAHVLEVLTVCGTDTPMAYAPLLAVSLVMSGETGSLSTKYTLAYLCCLCTAEPLPRTHCADMTGISFIHILTCPDLRPTLELHQTGQVSSDRSDLL